MHNKMRERRKGYPSRPEVGMKSPEKKIRLVSNMKELLKARKGEEVIVRKIGNKKRKEIENKAGELGVKILNERKQESNLKEKK
jgi:ribosomal protein L32E